MLIRLIIEIFKAVRFEFESDRFLADYCLFKSIVSTYSVPASAIAEAVSSSLDAAGGLRRN